MPGEPQNPEENNPVNQNEGGGNVAVPPVPAAPPTPVEFLGEMKSVKESVLSIAEDLSRVSRDLQVTLILKDITERQYRRLLRQYLEKKAIVVTIGNLQYRLQIAPDDADGNLPTPRPADYEMGVVNGMLYCHIHQAEFPVGYDCGLCILQRPTSPELDPSEGEDSPTGPDDTPPDGPEAGSEGE